mmetsp:Transcript_763/g.1600  ORF Transcript_763/g.1600 Transcript_763/m.1600 type:complete len:208 (+) Transcript_763:968-1591(+)
MCPGRRIQRVFGTSYFSSRLWPSLLRYLGSCLPLCWRNMVASEYGIGRKRFLSRGSPWSSLSTTSCVFPEVGKTQNKRRARRLPKTPNPLPLLDEPGKDGPSRGWQATLLIFILEAVSNMVKAPPTSFLTLPPVFRNPILWKKLWIPLFTNPLRVPEDVRTLLENLSCQSASLGLPASMMRTTGRHQTTDLYFRSHPINGPWAMGVA